MKKKILSIALFAGITTATYAQGEVNVLYLDGTPHVIAMTDIDKIELTKGSINIVKIGGASESIDINMIAKIELKANNKFRTYCRKAFGVRRLSYNWGINRQSRRQDYR